ncbi:ATP-grasp domain-containing protein [Dokdonella sp.]|uniref:ATP-grasp domain-containing protein n=1 Tax=Dokdonella sp. TaxID=2291710 RepID=UPI002F3E92D7
MSAAMRTLVVSNSLDAHVDAIVPLLHERGCDPFRLDLDAFPRDYDVVHGGSCAGRDAMTHRPSGDCLDLKDVRSVWTRKNADFSFSSELPAQELAFARMEAEHVLSSLLLGLDCFWMNHPTASRGAIWKGEQLRRATRFGFRTPATIITNRPQAAIRFKSTAHGSVVYKPMSASDLGASAVAADARTTGVLPTTVIGAGEEVLLSAVSEVPCLFQAYVDKQYEVRATVIGDRVFAVRLDSQSDERTRIDSRDMSAPIRYEPADLPVEVESACLAFVASYGLAFGAMDFVVTPGGEYVFLENNPAGQFLYVQQLVPELDLASAVADLLAWGAR